MTVEFWILGVFVFWFVSYFTIMKYNDMSNTELIFLAIVSLAPYVNFIGALAFILMTFFMVIRKKYGKLEWKNRKFVWVKDVETKEWEK